MLSPLYCSISTYVDDMASHINSTVLQFADYLKMFSDIYDIHQFQMDIE